MPLTDIQMPFDTNFLHLDSNINQRRHLGVAGLVVVTWFNVAGGPFGSEAVVGAGGPFIGLASLALVAVLWSLPVSLVTAEMSSAMPRNGGFSLWVKHAFGDFWAFQVSALQSLSLSFLLVVCELYAVYW